ncbi:MAG: protein kinase [Acidobacteriaceae bacterium]
MTSRGHAKMLDFGLAKVVAGARPAADAATATEEHLTSPGAAMGTVAYMSPEQVRGRDLDARSDLFSFGVVLYEMVTHAPPFRGETTGVIFDAILNRAPVAPVRLNPDLPVGLEAIINKALEKDCALRYQHAAEMRADLLRLRRDTDSRPAEANAAVAAMGSASAADAALPVQSADATSKLAFQRAHRGRWLIVTAAGLMVFLAAVVWYLERPLPVPYIAGYSQLTHDGRQKFLGGTDGNRLYFNLVSPDTPEQLSIAGGETAPLSLSQLPGGRNRIVDVSPNGSKLLLWSGAPPYTLWTQPLVAGAPKSLGPGLGGLFSPDGSAVVVWNESGEIGLIRPDGTGLRTLASLHGDGAYGLGEVSLSPDGKTIRFSKDGALLQINSDGTGLRPLLPGWHPQGKQFSGHWTADGAFYLFYTAGAPEVGGQVWALDERLRPFRHPSRAPVPLTSGPMHWSVPVPGRYGRTIFAVGETLRGELSRWDKNTHQFEPFLGGISTEELVFSRDGKTVAWVTYPDGILWRANRDGSNAVQLTQPPLHPMKINLSPDGRQIVFYDRARWQLDAVGTNGGAAVPLIPGERDKNLDPVQSPDGKQVAFTRLVENGGSWKIEARMLDMGSGQVAMMPGGQGMRPEGWSRDGRLIVGVEWNGNNLELFDLRTKEWKMLAAGEADYPEFSHDSRFIYFLRTVNDGNGENHMDVFRIAAAGGPLERVVDMKDFHTTGYWGFSLQLDPSDAPLVLRDISSADIYALNLSFR